MTTIAVVQSRHLIQNEGKKGPPYGYCWSTHQKAVDTVVHALDALHIPYVLWDENELGRTELLARKGVVAIVAPEVRVCRERTFQRLISLAEQGWIVFSAVDSFYYELLDSGDTERVMERRIRELFQLHADGYIRSRRLDKGQVEFKSTPFEWLTRGLPARPGYSRWIAAVLGDSEVLASHGEIRIDEAWSTRSEGVDERLQGKTTPAFLIREYPQNEGMFIYACFSLRKLENFKQILRNLWEFRSESRSGISQVHVLKILVIALASAVGLLLARELVGDTWPKSLGGIVAGLITGFIGSRLTDSVEKWLKG